MNKQTIIKTSNVQIGEKFVVVQTIKGEGRQDISYTVNGRPVSYNAFWKQRPVFMNN